VTGGYGLIDRQDKNLFFHTVCRLDLRPSSISFSDYSGSKAAGNVTLSDHLVPCTDDIKKVFFIPSRASVFKLGNLFPALTLLFRRYTIITSTGTTVTLAEIFVIFFSPSGKIVG
jgi:hypothetical protein